MWTTFLRRALFVVALLVAHAVSAACFCVAFNNPAWRTVVLTRVVGNVWWGIGAIHIVLAMWLAGRKDWWRGWAGVASAVFYVAAFVYGVSFQVPVQNWLSETHYDGWSLEVLPPWSSFPWPGRDINDFGMSIAYCTCLLFQVWLLLPVFKLTRFALVQRHQPFKDAPTISIGFMMLWTMLAAVIVTMINFLTWKVVLPHVSWEGPSAEVIAREFALIRTPSATISALVAFLIAWGWSGKIWRSLLVLVPAISLDTIAHQALYEGLRWGNVDASNWYFGGDASQRWSYFAGEVLMVWSAFGVARLLGVQLKRGELPDRRSEVAPTTDAATVN